MPNGSVEALRRTVDICKACGYCQGYCPVFEAIRIRSTFSNADFGYLANLCHNCRRCYHACQYAPPHEFDVNVPKVLAEARLDTYMQYAWPKPLAALFRANAIVIIVTVALAIAFAFVAPWNIMLGTVGTCFVFSFVCLTVNVLRAWRTYTGAAPSATSWLAAGKAATDVLTLRNLGGVRRYYHHAVFYGFLLCAAADAIAHLILNQAAAVAFGATGGFVIVAGSLGFLCHKIADDRNLRARRLHTAEYAFLLLVLLLASSGLAVLFFGRTAAIGVFFSIHIGLVLAFVLLLPHSKAVHGAYRAAALLHAATHYPI